MDRKVHKGIDLRQAVRCIIEMMEPGSRVLDVGSGDAALSRTVVELGGCRATSVEIAPERAALAEPIAEKVIVGSIEDDVTWRQIDGKFDYVVYADVLEHLADPWSVLRRSQDVLATGGRVIASIPNIAYYRIRQDILIGPVRIWPNGHFGQDPPPFLYPEDCYGAVY